MMVNQSTQSFQSVRVELSLRPLKLGFLVDPKDRSMLSKVFRLLSCLWGGPYCPIIPLTDGLPGVWESQFPRGKSPSNLTQDHLICFEPDLLVQTHSGQFAETWIDIGNNSFSTDRLVQLTELEEYIVTGGTVYPRGVAMDLVFDYLEANTFARQELQPRQSRVRKDSESETKDSFFDEVVFGLFPTTDRLKQMKQSFMSLSQKYSTHQQPNNPPDSQPDLRPFDCATYGLSVSHSPNHIEFFVCDPSSPTDVIEFWNYRIANTTVKALSVKNLPNSSDAILRTLELEDSSGDSNREYARATVYVASSLNVEDVERAIRTRNETHSFKTRVVFAASHVPSWISRSRYESEFFSPSRVFAKSETIEVIATRDTSYRVLMPVLKPDFIVDASSVDHCWVNVRQEHYFDPDDELASAVPSVWLNGESNFSRQILPFGHASREGYVSFHRFPDNNRQVFLATRREAIYKWLRSYCFGVSPSDAGRIADEVISSVGGLSEMHLCANADTIALFNEMAVLRREKGGIVEDLPGKTASIGAIKKHINRLEKEKKGTYTHLLQRYVNAGILQLGIAAKCTHCTKQNWYSLDAICSKIQCERCRKHFSFPEGEFPSDSTWKYRVVGPFATPDYAHGAYSVALTLAYLKGERFSGNAFTFVTGTELSRDDDSYEVDFIAWHQPQNYGRRPDPSTLVGECKSFGKNAFGEREVAGLKELGKLFPEAFLVASTLRFAFDDEEKSRLQDLARWSWSSTRNEHISAPLIVLTGNETLDGVFPYRRHQHANEILREIFERTRTGENFTNLARATQEAHLGVDQQEISRWEEA